MFIPSKQIIYIGTKTYKFDGLRGESFNITKINLPNPRTIKFDSKYPSTGKFLYGFAKPTEEDSHVYICNHKNKGLGAVKKGQIGIIYLQHRRFLPNKWHIQIDKDIGILGAKRYE